VKKGEKKSFGRYLNEFVPHSVDLFLQYTAMSDFLKENTTSQGPVK
jgi:hypothetical protein